MSGSRTAGDAAAGATWRSALALGLAVLLAVALLGAVERLAAGRIETARAERLAASLADVLPDTPFDNDPARDRVLVTDAALGGDGPRAVYRMRLEGRPVGAALSVVAPDGYSGAIALLVGVRADGRVVAVRVGEHRETPGLGDRIEHRRSDWITQFTGRGIDPSDPRGWRMTRGAENRVGGNARDAGATFDALTGATITSRAVVEAVHRALLWFETHREEVFAS